VATDRDTLQPPTRPAHPPLDFLVIGAAKSGTTTLFHYLRQHPQLFMPADKEAPFFSNDDRFALGWTAFAAEHFAGAPSGALLGKITPRYLGDPAVPERLARLMPDVKLLALLRNPIDRAFSKYRLLARKGNETRPFAAIVDEQLAPDALDQARHHPGPLRSSVVVRGEYARQLEAYLVHFPRERLLVHYTEELETEPQRVIDDVLQHLGLPTGWSPSNLGERYYVGGDRQRFPQLVPALRRMQPLLSLWHRVPVRQRRSLQHWYASQFNVAGGEEPEFPADVRARLVEFYRPDVARLQQLVGRPVPWSEFRPSG
jgi:hypothetical protein